MAQLTVPVVFDHDDLQRLVNEKIEEVKAQFIPKADYENRLKADMVAMLKDLRLEIEKIFDNRPLPCSHYQRTLFYGEVDDLILDKIDDLKGEQNGIHED